MHACSLDQDVVVVAVLERVSFVKVAGTQSHHPNVSNRRVVIVEQ